MPKGGESILEAVGPGRGGLRVEFVWHRDRFRHVVSVVAPGGKTWPLLESVEGSDSDDWPPGPPLAQLSMQTLPHGRRAALLVGMAGRSHWSASIEAAHDAAELRFDIACRHSAKPTWLGSMYTERGNADGHLEIRGGDVRISRENGILIVQPAAIQSAGTTRWAFAIRLFTGS